MNKNKRFEYLLGLSGIIMFIIWVCCSFAAFKMIQAGDIFGPQNNQKELPESSNPVPAL